MPIEIPKDKWPGSVREVTIGATAAEGGTRTRRSPWAARLPALHALRRRHRPTARSLL